MISTHTEFVPIRAVPWFIDPVNELTVVALTNTAFEGMVGRFTVDVRDAVYGA